MPFTSDFHSPSGDGRRTYWYGRGQDKTLGRTGKEYVDFSLKDTVRAQVVA